MIATHEADRMPDIQLHRLHDLGLARARQVAQRWAEEAEREFGMLCTVVEGETSDTVQFSRSGVNGQLVVAADHFDLQAQLGFLMGAFSARIQAEIVRHLDALLQAQEPPAAEPSAPAPSRAARRK